MAPPTTKEPSQNTHPPHLHNLASTILHNLQHQHEWTSLQTHTHSPLTSHLLPRPILSGIPPSPLYIHPDLQISVLKAEHETGISISQQPEAEWVLPTYIGERWSLKRFAEIFDALDIVPSNGDENGVGNEGEREEIGERVGEEWRGKNRQKRLLLATVHDDSTVVYYVMHDGIVKPRQN